MRSRVKEQEVEKKRFLQLNKFVAKHIDLYPGQVTNSFESSSSQVYGPSSQRPHSASAGSDRSMTTLAPAWSHQHNQSNGQHVPPTTASQEYKARSDSRNKTKLFGMGSQVKDKESMDWSSRTFQEEHDDGERDGRYQSISTNKATPMATKRMTDRSKSPQNTSYLNRLASTSSNKSSLSNQSMLSQIHASPTATPTVLIPGLAGSSDAEVRVCLQAMLINV